MSPHNQILEVKKRSQLTKFAGFEQLTDDKELEDTLRLTIKGKLTLTTSLK